MLIASSALPSMNPATPRIGTILPKPFKDILFTATYEYYHALSGIAYDASANNKFQRLLSKPWEF